ncbi:putative HAD-hydrolase YfnB [Clostridium puniceum]|uniref:Putative HAD-hydrolase YfnB n=1 Tax=Clostridium puniceum TaxID=29367 RepID=A0A1S8TEH7_9CLOT|nr:HAD family hydrolase [Clostridium puniceum]OOM76024.1 putative HAD-hydrolase YfnB [Clostridium puniceum]
MYTNYIFDLYGTLVDINTNENSKSLWEKLALFYSFNGAYYNEKGLKAAYKRKVKETLSSIVGTDYPDFPIENIFKLLFEDKDVHVSENTIKATTQMFRILSIKYLKLYDGVLELLDLLKEKKKKIYLLSNAQRIFTLYEMKTLKIYEYFDGIYFSSDHYVCKPDNMFYNKLLKEFSLDTKNTIMIGNDFIADIEGASYAGLDSLYINSNLSSEITKILKSKYNIMDGDVNKIAELIISK